MLFVVFALSLAFLAWLRSGEMRFPEGNEAIWFNSGLFALFLGTFITEYWPAPGFVDTRLS